MPGEETFLLILFLAVGGLFVILGLPLVAGRVPPNALYGYRTRRTLSDPTAWYPANRVCGYWCIATGLLTPAAALGMHLAGVRPPASVFATLAALFPPIVAMLVHSEIASRRPQSA
jgi:uncharacterized membrane protein